MLDAHEDDCCGENNKSEASDSIAELDSDEPSCSNILTHLSCLLTGLAGFVGNIYQTHACFAAPRVF